MAIQLTTKVGERAQAMTVNVTIKQIAHISTAKVSFSTKIGSLHDSDHDSVFIFVHHFYHSNKVFALITLRSTVFSPTRSVIHSSHSVFQIKSLEKELEEHQAYKPKGMKSKHGQLQVCTRYCIVYFYVSPIPTTP